MRGDAPSVIDFMRDYERLTNRHDIQQLAPLIAEDATYWFSDGSHAGRAAVLAAIGETFETIQDEMYSIANLEVVAEEPNLSVVRYRFQWSGTVGGSPRSGEGRGTNVIVRRGGRWLMLHEHLSA